MMRDTFIGAIHSKRQVRLTFYSQEDGHNLVRRCAPMDYGPSRRAVDKSNRFHLWDFDSDERGHTLSLHRNQVVQIEVLDERFDPATFVSWDTTANPWFIERDWGPFS